MNRTKKLIPILCGCLPLVLTLVFVLYALGTLFVPGPGGFYSRGRDQLDLRQQVLTVKRYQRLQKRMPDTRIRWNVPLGDGCYDSDTAVLYPGEFSPEDVSLFEYFPELRQVNGSRSQSHEALLALYEARPDLDVRWAVELGGKRLSQGCESLRFDAAELSTEELLDTLSLLPEHTSAFSYESGDLGNRHGLFEAQYDDLKGYLTAEYNKLKGEDRTASLRKMTVALILQNPDTFLLHCGQNALVGLIRTVAILHPGINLLVCLFYIGLFLLILLFRRYAPLRRERQFAALSLLCAILNAAVIAPGVFALSRYMFYNMPILYAMVVVLFHSLLSEGKRLHQKLHTHI